MIWNWLSKNPDVFFAGVNLLLAPFKRLQKNWLISGSKCWFRRIDCQWLRNPSHTIGGAKLFFDLFSRSFRFISGLKYDHCLKLTIFLVAHLTYLYIFLDPNKTLFEGIKTGWVEHFFLDTSCIWAPWHQKQFLLASFLGSALALMLIFKVV